MPLNKAKLHSITEGVTLDYLGEQVRVTYYPLRVLSMTQERAETLQRELQETATAAEQSGDLTAFYAIIGGLWSTYLAGWDVTEDEGPDAPPVPLDDGAALFALDPRFDLFSAILSACREAAAAGKARGTVPHGRIGASSAPDAPTGSNRSAASSPTPLRSRTSRSKRASRQAG